MILTQQQVDRLVQGKPVQVRKLVKEGETWDRESVFFEMKNKKGSTVSVQDASGKIKPIKVKWQVGRDYAVQLGGEKWTTISADESDEEFLRKLKEDAPRGAKAGLWYCPKCGNFNSSYQWHKDKLCAICYDKMNIWRDKRIEKIKIIPLRIKITGIRKERFCDVDLDDAKEEGFETTWDSMKDFCKKNKIAYEGQYLTDDKETWVLTGVIK